MKNIKNYLLALFAGLLFPLGLAPFNGSGLTILSISIWFYLLQNPSKKKAAKLSLAYGLGKYGLGISWIYVSISNFSELPWIFSALITFGFILFLSTYEILFGIIYQSLAKKSNQLMRCFLFASIGVLIETLRSWAFTGLPWLLAGHSQLLTPLHKLAPLMGSISISFLCYLMAAFLINALLIEQNNRTKNYCYAFLMLLPFLLCDTLLPDNWTTKIEQLLTVSLLQGNIAHDLKWDENHLINTLDTYQKLTNERLKDDLIVWPETAMPMPNIYALDIFTELSLLAKTHKTTLILGAPGMNEDNSMSNSLFLLGKEVGRYDKQHLVPFGEYMPLTFLHPLYQFFNIPFSNLNQGKHANDLFKIKELTLVPFICFEIAFNTPSNLKRIANSNLILTLTDDSWFGHSLAKAQHLQIAQMLSLETGRPQLFASNDGLTAVINNQGALIKTLPPFKKGYLHSKVNGYKGNTPFIQWGKKPIELLSLFIIIFAVLL